MGVQRVNAMELKGLGHLYRNGRGVKRVDLQVEQGEVFGFLGPNAAGKTTLIRTLLGFLSPTVGSATVLGLDIVRDKQEVLKRVGYLASDPALYDTLTGYQNLDFAMRIRGCRDYDRLKDLAGKLGVDLGQRFRTLSRGNKQKVAILNALVHDPDLLILDEPTTGLDPLVQEAARSIILGEKSRGKTVFMSSHDLAEVEAVADRVGIIRDGEMVAVDRVENLRRQRMKYVAFEVEHDWSGIASLPGVLDLRQDGRKVRFTYTGKIPALLESLQKWGVVDLSITDPPLEDVFLSFYGQDAETGRG
jgi:ABC-2 type transport system ATP-binding protein